MKQQTKTIQKPHHVRTLIAALLGFIGVGLILASILVVWLNRTLTDTTTFSATVAPLVTKPAIQNFVAGKVTDQLLQSASPQDIATTLLPASQTTGKSPEQLKDLAQADIHKSVLQIVHSPSFATLWKQTTTSAHQQLITQLGTKTTQLTLDLSPAVTGVIQQLKQTDLAPISDKISVKPETGKLNLKGGGIDKAHHFYTLFQEGTIAIVVLAALMIGLSVLASVHHKKTIRRIVFVTGIGTLLTAGLITLPSLLKLGGNDPDKAAARAFSQVLLHNLQLSCLIIGILCIVGAVGSKLLSRRHGVRTA